MRGISIRRIPAFVSMSATQELVRQTNGCPHYDERHLLASALNAFCNCQSLDYDINPRFESPISQRQLDEATYCLRLEEVLEWSNQIH